MTAKDLALHMVGRLGTAVSVGHAIEFCGPAIGQMEVEGRLTLRNLAVELGARSGVIAPDQRTFDYLRARPFAPVGEAFDTAIAHWRKLASDRIQPSIRRRRSMRRPFERQ